MTSMRMIRDNHPVRLSLAVIEARASGHNHSGILEV
jgi:hypothetical protein